MIRRGMRVKYKLADVEHRGCVASEPWRLGGRDVVLVDLGGFVACVAVALLMVDAACH